MRDSGRLGKQFDIVREKFPVAMCWRLFPRDG